MKFNSAICTSVEESKRLLELGLKKETADCNYPISMLDGRPCECIRVGNPSEQNYNAFPAWSLHRLMEIAYNGDILGGVILNFHERNIGTYYEQVIKVIEYLIGVKEFNKDYLEEKK